MMYVWNGFNVVGKRPELTENILTTLEKAEEHLRDNPSEWNSRTSVKTLSYVFFLYSKVKLTSVLFNV